MNFPHKGILQDKEILCLMLCSSQELLNNIGTVVEIGDPSRHQLPFQASMALSKVALLQ